MVHRVKIVQIRSFFCSVFSCIWTEYLERRSLCPYLVRMLEKTDQKIIPYLETFHAVVTFITASIESIHQRLSTM